VRWSEWILQNNSLLEARVAERAAYLKKINTTEVCDEDQDLPRELIDKYFNGGKNLTCPSGTTSERNSWCLGQC
jgi:hypothetical protein